MTVALSRYSDLFKGKGPWCTVLTDVGTGTVDSLEAADVRPEHLRDQLLAAGASKSDAEAVEQAVRPLEGEANPVARYVLVRNGQVEIDKVLAGERVDSPYVNVGIIPDLLPLIRHSDLDTAVVAASVDRTGADITLSFARRGGETFNETTKGSTENIKKVPGGGWAQGKFQHRTEEIWRKNTEEVVAEIDRLVEKERPAVVVIGGDLRARDMVLDQLSQRSRALTTTVDAHTRASGADPDVLNTAVEKSLAESQARSQQQLLDKLEEEKGQNSAGAAFGVGSVVQALQQAQVQTLVLTGQLTADPGAGNTATDPQSRPERSLLVLGASPWLATTPEQALGAEVLGEAPAAAALIRAAVLTDAEVEVVPAAAIPGGAPAAALLRWETGPAVPGGQ